MVSTYDFNLCLSVNNDAEYFFICSSVIWIPCWCSAYWRLLLWREEFTQVEETEMCQITSVRNVVFSLLTLLGVHWPSWHFSLYIFKSHLDHFWPLLFQILFSSPNSLYFQVQLWVYVIGIYIRKVQKMANWPLWLKDRLYDSLWSEIRVNTWKFGPYHKRFNCLERSWLLPCSIQLIFFDTVY